MSNRALTWAFAQTTGKGVATKAVLVALADMADEQDSCWPSQELLADRTEQTDRSVRNAVKHLEEAGFLTRRPHFIEGKRQNDRYFLAVEVTAERRTVKKSTSSRSNRNDVPVEPPTTGTKQQEPPEPDSKTTGTTFPVTLNEPKDEPSVGATAAAADAGALFDVPQPPLNETLSVQRRAQLLAKDFYELRPMVNFPAVMEIVKKAIYAKHGDDAIRDALVTIARDGRTLTVEVLRIALEGAPSATRQGATTATARERLERDRQRERMLS